MLRRAGSLVLLKTSNEDVAFCFGFGREELGKIDESGKVEFEERIRR